MTRAGGKGRRGERKGYKRGGQGAPPPLPLLVQPQVFTIMGRLTPPLAPGKWEGGRKGEERGGGRGVKGERKGRKGGEGKEGRVRGKKRGREGREMKGGRKGKEGKEG